jgi:hypothetical protein
MKKRRKAHTVDAMMRFFLQYYNIPTKQDIDRLVTRMDRLEKLIRSTQFPGGGSGKTGRRKAAGHKKTSSRGRAKMTATDKVMSIIKRSPRGVDISTLKAKSGFEDKKIRNIVFRLSREGTIERIGRGVYTIN